MSIPSQGILCINKPEGFTSFDVIAKMRRITGVRKIGHAGTLDPMATGVLPLFFGRATRLTDLMPRQDKTYVAGFALGQATDTQDCTGTTISTSSKKVTKEEVLTALEQFRGEISQLPPMYSAVSVGGRRLYDLAREGKVVERQPRRVTIHSLDLLDFSEETQQGKLQIHCSKGTYVRTICHDLGQNLGTGGMLISLIRTTAGVFTLDDCITLPFAEECADLSPYFLPTDTPLREHPQLNLSEKQARMFCNGVKLNLSRLHNPPTTRCRVCYDSQFLGLAEPNADTDTLNLVRLFAASEDISWR